MRVRTAQAVLAFVCVTFAVLIGRLAYIQAKMRPTLLAYSEARQTGVIPLPGCRGIILDSRKRVLAGSQQRPTIYADPTLIEDHEQQTPTASVHLTGKCAYAAIGVAERSRFTYHAAHGKIRVKSIFQSPFVDARDRHDVRERHPVPAEFAAKYSKQLHHCGRSNAIYPKTAR